MVLVSEPVAICPVPDAPIVQMFWGENSKFYLSESIWGQ